MPLVVHTPYIEDVMTWCKAAVVWLALSSVSSAAPLEDIQTCLASNVPEKSSAVTVRLQSRTRAGQDHAHEAKIYWKRSADGVNKTLLCMTSPRDVRGLTYVVHEQESRHALWVYLPEEERVVRINPGEAARRGHIAQTAINYEDIRYLPVNLISAVQQRDADSLLGDRTVSVVRFTLPPESGSHYDHVTFFVDPESCVPLKTDFYETAERLSKVASADPDTIQREGAIRLARSITIRDLVRGVETEIVVEEVEIDSDLPDRMFDPQSQRGRCPR